MIIRKVQNPRGWTTTPNAMWDDNRLSYRARGVLGWLLSRPDGWETDIVRMARNGPLAPKEAEDAREGRDAIRAAMRELEHYGYLWRPRTQTERGRWRTDVLVYDEPIAGPGELQRFPDRPHVDKAGDNPVENDGDGSLEQPHRRRETRRPADPPSLTTNETHRDPATQRNHRGQFGRPVEKNLEGPAPRDVPPAAPRPTSKDELALDAADRRALGTAGRLFPGLDVLALRARLVAEGRVDPDLSLEDTVTLLRAASELAPLVGATRVDAAVVELLDRVRPQEDSPA